MTKLYLIRHAEAEGNLYRLAHGHYNSTITPRGYRQLAALRKRFREIPVDAVYGSDLLRTQTTASAIYRPKNLPFRPLPLLREVCVGVWEEKSWAEIQRMDREMLENFNHRPDLWHVEGAEDFAVVRERMLQGVRQIIAENPGKTVVATSHGSALRVLLGALRGLTLEETGTALGHCDNTGVTLLEAEGPEEIRIVFQEDVSHLPRELSTLSRQNWHKGRMALVSEPGLWYQVTDDGPEGRSQRAMLEEQAVGAIDMALAPGALRIRRYEIDPAHRGKRLGTQLMGQVVQYARHQGREKVVLTCGEDTEAFFAQFGFVTTAQQGGEREMEMDIRLVIRDIPED